MDRDQSRLHSGSRRPRSIAQRSGPTLAGGSLFLTTLDDRVVGLNAANGERLWSYQGTTTSTTVLTGAAPAVSEGFVVAGFGSGELVALRADNIVDDIESLVSLRRQSASHDSPGRSVGR